MVDLQDIGFCQHFLHFVVMFALYIRVNVIYVLRLSTVVAQR